MHDGPLTRMTRYYRAHGAAATVTRTVQELVGLVDYPWQAVSTLLPGPANEIELRVFALRRSGHHAVVNWITRQRRGRHCFLNNCEPDRNPFEACNRSQSRVHSGLVDHVYVRWKAESRGSFSRKGLLVYNYEDRPFREVLTDNFARNRERWVGASERRFDVLILRDPFNQVASLLRWARGKRYTPSFDELRLSVNLWKEYAAEFLRQTRCIEDPLCISFNDWFADPEYRRAICDRIGLPFTDRGLNRVARWGPARWGDSFDGLHYDGNAQSMRVLERWKSYEADSEFRSLVGDPELHDMSREIFGTLPGTESLASP